MNKPAGEPDSVHLASVPRAGRSDGGSFQRSRSRRGSRSGRQLMDVRREVLNELWIKPGKRRRLAPARSQGDVVGERRDCIRCSSSIQRDLPDLFIVSQVALAPGTARTGSDGRSRRRRKVRTLLEIHNRCRYPARYSSVDLRRVRGGGSTVPPVNLRLVPIADCGDGVRAGPCDEAVD